MKNVPHFTLSTPRFPLCCGGGNCPKLIGFILHRAVEHGPIAALTIACETGRCGRLDQPEPPKPDTRLS